MNNIIISSPNPRDITSAELALLADEIRTLQLGVDVSVFEPTPPPGSYAVTLYEVVTVWLPAAGFYADVLARTVRWARSRKGQDGKRPKSITIYDLEGRPLGSIVIREDAIDERDPSSLEPKKPPTQLPWNSKQ